MKYKNLAHVHNRWVSESDIVDSTLQGCDLISKFSKRIHNEKVITCAMSSLVHLFFSETVRLFKSMSADSFLSECDS